jgi:hypothetical protein
MEMNDGDRRRLARSGMLSGGLWIVLLILAVFVPMRKIEPKAPAFAPVKITFAVKTVAREPVAAPEPEPVQEPPAPSSLPAEAKQTLQRSTSTKSTAATRSPAPAKTSGGLGIPNFSTSSASTSSRTDDGSATLEFSSADLPAPGGKSTRPAPSAVQEISGVAGSIDKGGSTRVSATGTVSRPTGGSVSADTARTLESIGGSVAGDAGDAGSQGAAAGQGSSSVPTGSSSTVANLAFDGAARKLLSPETPSITLPARLARLVDSDRTVTVQFTVLADGTVPSGLVSFTPSAVLPAEIRDYLRKEFSSWRFEKGAADGQASFRYSIRVK